MSNSTTSRDCPYCETPMMNPRRVQCGAPDCKRKYNAERQRKFQRDYHERTGAFHSR